MNLSDEDIDDGGGDEWLATWADAITLLMAFFVMMFAEPVTDFDSQCART